MTDYSLTQVVQAGEYIFLVFAFDLTSKSACTFTRLVSE
jgi:hypothetical protein